MKMYELFLASKSTFMITINTGECRDYKGVAVQNGQVYRRGANPCEECVCNGGFADNCVEMVCDEPPCRNHRLIPNTCCGFVCLPELPDTIEGWF